MRSKLKTANDFFGSAQRPPRLTAVLMVAATAGILTVIAITGGQQAARAGV